MACPEHLDRRLYYITSKHNLASFVRLGSVPSVCVGPDVDSIHSIWAPDFDASRSRFELPLPSRPLLDSFVPLHVTSKPPALYPVVTGFNVARVSNVDLVLLRTTVRILLSLLVSIVIVDRQPLSTGANFIPGSDGLETIDCDLVASGVFKNHSADMTRSSRMGAEVLAHRNIPLAAFDAIVCWDGEDVLQTLIDQSEGPRPRVTRDCAAFFSRGG